MPRRAKPSHCAERGVYLASYTANGDRHYYSVTSKGERLSLVPVPLGADPMEAIDQLWLELDRLDPVSGRRPHDASSVSLKLLA